MHCLTSRPLDQIVQDRYDCQYLSDRIVIKSDICEIGPNHMAEARNMLLDPNERFMGVSILVNRLYVLIGQVLCQFEVASGNNATIDRQQGG